MIVRVIKFFAKGLLAFLMLLLLYFVAALIGSAIPVNTDRQAGGDITIYLRTNGAHTDFIFPVENNVMDWEQMIDSTYILSKKGNYDYISFGWGDLEFYRNTPEWSDLTFPTAMQAVFLPTPSAMHVEFESPPRFDQPTVPIRVTEEEYRTLVDYVKWSFQKDFSGNVRPVPDLHYNQNDAFFYAKRSLNSFYTCNTWVNNGLKEAGLPACLWTPFDEGIFYKYH
ncbi:TIGR02117 family protein [Salinimicrobium sp. TH3]|uniref:TIGR02117 family protein n=1 Tax=Salinimicrobium sp. TH3 TaxID=2997342 RepID=UPI002272C169|nr:TIGR02117 family protein [Salinimicrobium sp. TH3]MCY2687423.1 TIGR02117 family protein [Salinimicrobium sp. TH3]